MLARSFHGGSLPVLLLLLVSVAPTLACGSASADDVSADAAEPPVLRRTLTCTFESAEGIDLETGEVLPVAPSAASEGDVDLSCFMGRFIGLTSTDGVCRSSAVERRAFADIDEVPGSCACTGEDCWGANLLCGVISSPFAPACTDIGIVVRDRRQRVYRLRVLSDEAGFGVGAAGAITFEVQRVLP